MPAHQGLNLTLIYRLELENTSSTFGKLAAIIGEAGGDIIAVDTSDP